MPAGCGPDADASPYAHADPEVPVIAVSLLLPQFPGSRRVVPLVIDPTQTANLRALLEQDEAWVGRARWVKWLDRGDDADTMRIDEMVIDDRIAACAWLRQQRHVLHATVADGGPAPAGWVESLPLYAALQP